MREQFEITLRNQRQEIARLQDELERFCAENALPRRPLHELQTAVEEHLTNILHYAYADAAAHGITVRVALAQPELRIEIEDDGRPFNLLEHPAPDLSAPLDERAVGGLGIHMMKKSLDRLEYRYEHGKNIVTMTKRLTAPVP